MSDLEPCALCGRSPVVYMAEGMYCIKCNTEELYNYDRGQVTWQCRHFAVVDGDLVKAIRKWNKYQKGE